MQSQGILKNYIWVLLVRFRYHVIVVVNKNTRVVVLTKITFLYFAPAKDVLAQSKQIFTYLKLSITVYTYFCCDKVHEWD